MKSLFGFIVGRVLSRLRPAMIRGSSIGFSATVEGGCKFYNSTLARHSFCGFNCEIFHADIGSFTSIGDGVIVSGGRHPMDWASMSPVFYAGRDSVKSKFSEFERAPIRRTVVGSDVWIGRSAIILEGVTIGDGAVIGAGSVVTKDIPAYAIFAGNPARLIRYRFDEETRAALIASRWWDMEDGDIAQAASHIKDPLRFLQALTNRDADNG